MSIEIERKFLVNKSNLISLLEFMPHCSYDIWQYYINENFRLRIETHSNGQEESWLMIKTDSDRYDGPGIKRNEWKSSISNKEANDFKNIIIKSKIGLGYIRKSRHLIRGPYADTKWEIDIFHGSNEGLIIVEIELPCEEYDLGDLSAKQWLGKEVTDDERYYNAYLAKNPYQNWRKDDG